ncbi:MAG: hypothetical protein RLZZ543_955 [Bacteroidota bacterium]|jgi:hypothetical protein
MRSSNKVLSGLLAFSFPCLLNAAVIDHSLPKTKNELAKPEQVQKADSSIIIHHLKQR